MPIYEYACSRCGSTFKHLHRSFDEPAPPCPECGHEKVNRLFSTFAVKTSNTPCGAQSCPADSGHKCCPGCCHHGH